MAIKKKKWVFLKVLTYLALAVSVFIFSMVLYYFIRERSFRSEAVIMSAFAVGALLQIIFTVCLIRVLHQLLPQERAIDKPFLMYYNIAIGGSCIVSAAICFVLFFGMRETFFHHGRLRNKLDTLDLIMLSIVSLYTFITLYTTVGAVRLSKYLLAKDASATENWLQQLDSVNQ